MAKPLGSPPGALRKREGDLIPREGGEELSKATALPGAQSGLAPSGAEVGSSTAGSQFGRGCLGREEGKAPLRAN